MKISFSGPNGPLTLSSSTSTRSHDRGTRSTVDLFSGRQKVSEQPKSFPFPFARGRVPKAARKGEDHTIISFVLRHVPARRHGGPRQPRGSKHTDRDTRVSPAWSWGPGPTRWIWRGEPYKREGCVSDCCVSGGGCPGYNHNGVMRVRRCGAWRRRCQQESASRASQWVRSPPRLPSRPSTHTSPLGCLDGPPCPVCRIRVIG